MEKWKSDHIKRKSFAREKYFRARRRQKAFISDRRSIIIIMMIIIIIRIRIRIRIIIIMNFQGTGVKNT